MANNDKNNIAHLDIFHAVIGRSDAAALPEGYEVWRKEIIALIEQAKYKAALSVNSKLLSLYWKIGTYIIKKQKEQGWGSQVVEQLAKDLSSCFPDDRGYSARNLWNMKRFAQEYPDFPFLQVPLAEIQNDPILQVALAELKEIGKDYVQVPLAQITWYHHISLIPKVKDVAQRAFYIMEYVKAPEDKPTIGLLLCRTKSDTKARFALRGITQPLGIAQYETEKLFADVASSLPQIEEMEDNMEKEDEK